MTAPNPGDYCVLHTNGWAAKGIRLATRSTWNHAAIYIGDGQIIEADPSGVQVSPLSNYDGMPVLWSNLTLNTTKAAKVLVAAKAQIGLGYGWVDVAAIGLSTLGIVIPKLDDPSTRFCSQVVAQAFRLAGIPLCVKAANRVTPGDLADLIGGRTVPKNW